MNTFLIIVVSALIVGSMFVLAATAKRVVDEVVDIIHKIEGEEE